MESANELATHFSGRPLLTDVAMPDMNGLDLTDRVLKVDSKLPVLLMSGDMQSANRGLGCLVKRQSSC